MLTAAGLLGEDQAALMEYFKGPKEKPRMITRYALFEGTLHPGHQEAFRRDVLAEDSPRLATLPRRARHPRHLRRGPRRGRPRLPLILAIDWPDRATVDAFLTRPIRKEGRAATEAVLARHFTGRIHHHVTTAHSFAPA